MYLDVSRSLLAHDYTQLSEIRCSHDPRCSVVTICGGFDKLQFLNSLSGPVLFKVVPGNGLNFCCQQRKN